MAKPRYTRQGCDVLRNGKLYATAKDTVAAANIADALNRAEP